MTGGWRAVSFATPAGSGGSAFDHNLTVFPLTGRHTVTDCKKCHVNDTFKGTPTTCVSCHTEPKVHAGSKLGTDCQKCHTTSAWTGATLGDSKHTFPITHGGGGGKKPKTCVTCHAPADQFKTYTCYGCHRHDPAATAKKHMNKGIANIQNCVACHPTGGKVKRPGKAVAGNELLTRCPEDECAFVPEDVGGRCPHDQPGSAWATENGRTLGQEAVADGGHALTTVPTRVRALVLRSEGEVPADLGAVELLPFRGAPFIGNAQSPPRAPGRSPRTAFRRAGRRCSSGHARF